MTGLPHRVHGQCPEWRLIISSLQAINWLCGEENGDARFIKAVTNGIPIVNLYHKALLRIHRICL